MINKPPPFKGLNIRIPIIIPMKGKGLLVRGLGLRVPSPKPLTLLQSELSGVWGT